MAGWKTGKGSVFERNIAKRFGKWLYDDEAALWRVGGSGGRAERYRRVRKRGRGSKDLPHPGDIVPEKPCALDFPFCIECKYRQTWTIDGLLKPGGGQVFEWWLKNVKDARREFIPLLILKKNHYPELGVLSRRHVPPELLAVDAALTGTIGPRTVYIFRLDALLTISREAVNAWTAHFRRS